MRNAREKSLFSDILSIVIRFSFRYKCRKCKVTYKILRKINLYKSFIFRATACYQIFEFTLQSSIFLFSFIHFLEASRHVFLNELSFAEVCPRIAL